MSLIARYAPSDIRRVLQVALRPGPFVDTGFGTILPAYYESDHAFVLCPTTDTVREQGQQMKSIDQAFDAINTADLADKVQQRKIIIPVAEEQKILGLFPRNHWVTLHYDPKTNSADLIDSRPWLMSFLYPTSSMRDLLKSGLKKLYPAEVIDQMSFNTHYQGVQLNDTHCGAWTTTNIRDLSGANVRGKMNEVTNQKSAYSSSDERGIVDYNINSVAQKTLNVISKEALKPQIPIGFFQLILAFLGITKAQTHQVENVLSLPDKESDYSSITKDLVAANPLPASGPSPASKETLDNDDDWIVSIDKNQDESPKVNEERKPSQDTYENGMSLK